jgi:hypothetical protein
MNGLLANPVISGLLSGGPNAIRAAAEQQRLALAPRGGGGMSGAPGAIVTQDRSGADLGAGLAGLGKGLSAIGKMRADAKRQEVEDQAIAQYLGQVNDPVQKERLTTLAGTPEGRQAIMAGVAKQAFPSAAGPLKAGDLVTVQTPNGPRFVQANDAIGQQPVAKEPAGDKLRLWYGDRSVDVTPGSDMERRYLSFGYKETPTLPAEKREEGPSFKNEKDLRGEVIAINKDMRGVVDQFGRVETAVNNPSPANDIALVFSYMKMLDPTSVVREGEQATAQNAGGIPERVRAQWNRLQSGEQFTDGLRRDFYQSARDLYERKNADYQRDLGFYRELAGRNGLNPDNVVFDISRAPTGMAEAPSPVQTVPATPNDAPPARQPGAASAATLSPEQSAFRSLSPARQAGALETIPEDQQDAYLDLLTPEQMKQLRNEMRRRGQ